MSNFIIPKISKIVVISFLSLFLLFSTIQAETLSYIDEQANALEMEINLEETQKANQLRSGVKLTTMPTTVGSPNFTGTLSGEANFTMWRQTVDGAERLFFKVEPLGSTFWTCVSSFSITQNSVSFDSFRFTLGDDVSVCEDITQTKIYLVDQWSHLTNFTESEAFELLRRDVSLIQVPSASQTGCVSGDCENGQGTFIYDNGDKYVGQWQDGKRSGDGVYTWSDGDKYEGKYVAGSRSGLGAYTWSDGAKYVGEYLSNLRSGLGTYTATNGSLLDGIWKDNEILVGSSSADIKVDTDVLFNWAEKTYPDLFAPADRISQTFEEWYYRFYPTTNDYLGLNTNNLDISVLGDIFGGLLTVGGLRSLMVQANLKSVLEDKIATGSSSGGTSACGGFTGIPCT